MRSSRQTCEAVLSWLSFYKRECWGKDTGGFALLVKDSWDLNPCSSGFTGFSPSPTALGWSWVGWSLVDWSRTPSLPLPTPNPAPQVCGIGGSGPFLGFPAPSPVSSGYSFFLLAVEVSGCNYYHCLVTWSIIVHRQKTQGEYKFLMVLC